ncbi:hypothetical protein [Alkalihalobacillus sp. BA299]|uniref:hypothetical protein n=1 Tax=Alkalihalobacillus sp. BA299 TaxID=2815938 RepID=UPI001ADD3274|nr:hypothetical protein [Alkalihalobacillus sp. BA299]
MIGLMIAVILFNSIAFITNKRLSKNQIVHIWTFTIAFQLLFDEFIDQKYQGYWYFAKGVNWESLPALTMLIPPVNVMFLNWYPFDKSLLKRILYFIFWLHLILTYEVIALLPEPWGYFNYGWWNIWLSALIDPVLLIIILKYYRWICKIEKNRDLSL